MKAKTISSFQLFVASIITTSIIMCFYIVTQWDTESVVENNNVNDSQFFDYDIKINQSFLDNQTINLYDKNGTLLFEGLINNETLWNTSLNLTMTFREFVNMIAPYIFDYDMYKIIEQVAYQLNEELR